MNQMNQIYQKSLTWANDIGEPLSYTKIYNNNS